MKYYSMPLAKQPWKLNTKSLMYKAFIEAGFTLLETLFVEHDPRIDTNPDIACTCNKCMTPGVFIKMKCVCGNVEVGYMSINTSVEFWDSLTGLVDVAAWIEKVGALSPTHLANDGYKKEDIIRIRKPFREVYAALGKLDPYEPDMLDLMEAKKAKAKVEPVYYPQYKRPAYDWKSVQKNSYATQKAYINIYTA